MRHLNYFLVLLLFIFINNSSSFSQQVMYEDFESGSFPPAGWVNYFAGISNGGWQIDGGLSHSPTHSAFHYVDLNYMQCDNWLISPPLDLSSLSNPELSYFEYEAWIAYYQGHHVYYSTDYDGISDPTDPLFTWVEIHEGPGVNWSWSEVGPLELPIVESIYIAFRFVGFNADGWVLDDILIEDAPSCPKPIDLYSTYVFETEATLGWTEVGSATSWQIEWGEVGFTQGNGTLIAEVTTNPYNLTGLTGATVYEWYVRSVCGIGDTSCWSDLNNTFQTSCITIQSFPWVDSLDYYPFVCWPKSKGLLGETVVLSGTYSVWIGDDFSNVEGNSRCARLNVYGSEIKDWFFTPEIDLGDGTTNYQLQFDLALTEFNFHTPPWTNGYDDKFAVVISIDGGITWSSDNILQLWDNDEATISSVYNDISLDGENITINLSDYTGLIKIGFYGESTVFNADNDLFIDNVRINANSSGASQAFDLSTGFQFISSSVIPEDINMLSVIDEILNDNLDYVRNSQGSVLRKIGPNWVNNIGDWIVEEGYLIKMFASDSFIINGIQLDPTSPIPVETGFQFVSYLPESSMDALDAFVTIIGDNLDFIRNSQGQTLRKIGPNWINGIGDCQPGEGYLLKMFASGEIIYPAIAKSSGKTTLLPSNLIFKGGNPADPVYTIYIDGLEIGDEVAAYDGDKMVGAVRINSENSFENELPVFSTLTNGTGYEKGNLITLKVWSEKKLISADFKMESIYDAYVSDVFPEGDGKYSVANIIKGKITTDDDIVIYPNPANNYINIISSNEIKSIYIYNNLGLLVFQGKSNEINVKNFESGIYLMKIDDGKHLINKKILIE